MNVRPHKLNLAWRSILLAGAFGWVAVYAHAAPDPAAATGREPVKKSEVASPMVCDACKTTTLEDSIHVDKDSGVPLVMGVKHDCSHCHGSIIAVRGRTTNCMLHECPMCGKGASLCIEETRLAFEQASRRSP